MSGNDSILKKFLEAEQPRGDLQKEAAAQAQADAVTQLFLNSCAAAGWTEDGLAKFASENPQPYDQMFQDWLVSANEELSQQQKMAALEKQAEAQYMQKMAEDVLSGRVMAYAFVDELGQIFQHMQKQGGEMPPQFAENAEKRKEEAGEKDEDEKKETPAEEKKEEKEEEKDEKDEKKEGSSLPLKVQVIRAAIEKAAAAGYQPTQQEVDLLAACKVSEAGMKVEWPKELQ